MIIDTNNDGVTYKDLLSDNFLRKNTEWDSFDSFCESILEIGSEKELDIFIDQSSNFNSFENMVESAFEEYLDNELSDMFSEF